MKVNMPVTDKEVKLAEGQTLVSKTDLKGITTYVNKEFVEISGFSEQELVGKNHNIVRHPDMPPAAFKDLWDIVKQGRPWNGIVKNRCKNGDFYWVNANVIPITENGTIVEYMSVRSKPTEEMIRNAEALYRDINAGVLPGKSLAQKLREAYHNISVKMKLALLSAVIAIILIAGGLAMFNSVSEIENGWQDYQSQVNKKGMLLSKIKDEMGYGGGIQNFKNYVIRGEAKYLQRAQANFSALSTALDDYKGLPDLAAEEKQAVNHIRQVADQYSSNLGLVESLVQQGKSPVDIDHAVKIDDSPALSGIELLARFQSQHAQSLTSVFQQRIDSATWTLWLERLLLLALVSSLLYLFVTRTLLKPLSGLLASFKRINEGKYENEVELRREDEIGLFMQGVHVTQIKMRFDLESSAKLAEEALRIQNALDVCRTNVMVADNSFNIIYMNNSLTTMFSEAEADIRKDLPDFDCSSLLYANADIFHRNPQHQRQVVENLTSPYSASINVGGRTFSMVATPVFNERKQRLGTVIEWLDLTEKLRLEEQERKVADANARMKQALDSVSANVMVADENRNIIYMNPAVIKTLGHAESDIRKDLPNFAVENLMGNSIDVFHKNPSHQRQLLENLVDEYSAEIVVGGRYLSLVVNPITNEAGTRLGTAVEWTDRTDEVAIEQEIDKMIEAAAAGDFSTPISLAGKEGFFRVLSEGLNRLVGVMDDGIRDVLKAMSAMAKGDLTERITREYQGTFDALKNNVNQTCDRLTQVITQVREASDNVHTGSVEISQGNSDLSVRTEAQASSLQETASSMEEITSTVRETAHGAMEARDVSDNVRKKAAEGGEVVKQAVAAMDQILEASNKINDIIGVIDEIAFQTNLLALNAAVEAARAGEQGRGFAVVAGEVRSLSQRSAQAAKEIKDLIRDSVSKVETGSKLVNHSGDTLLELVQAVDNVAARISEIANAAEEQTSGIEQINQAITQMDDMTQQNAALVEEAGASSQALSEQAATLNSLMGFFRVDQASTSRSGDHQPASVPAPQRTPELRTVSAPATGRILSVPSDLTSSGTSGDLDDDEWQEF